MAETLKDFLISIGFKVDATQAQKALDAVKRNEQAISATVTKEGVERMTAAQYRAEMLLAREKEIADQRAKIEKKHGAEREVRDVVADKKARERREVMFKDIEKFAVRFGAVASKVALAVAGTATSIVYAVNQAAKGFEQLNYASGRIGASPKAITSFGYASAQTGSSAAGGQAALEALGERLRKYQGYREALNNLGIKTEGRDTADIATDLGDVLRRTSQSGPNGYVQAINRANMFGVDEIQARALMDPRFRQRRDEYNRDQAKIGNDPNAAARSGTAFEQSMRHLEEVASSVADKIDTNLFQKLQPLLDALAKWLAENAQKITEVVSQFADGFLNVATQLSGVLLRLNGTNGLQTALEALATYMAGAWLLKTTLAIGQLTKAFGPLTALLGLAGLADSKNILQPPTSMTTEGIGNAIEPGLGTSLKKAWNWTKGKLGFGGGASEDDASGSDDPLKKFITRHEGGGYNVAYGHAERGGPFAPPKALTDMTISEVLAYQHEMRGRAGSAAFPVGRAQWTESTLRALTRGMDPNTKFSAELQERLFDKSIAGRMGQGAAGFRSEWASLGGVSDADINAAIAGHRSAFTTAGRRGQFPPKTSIGVTKQSWGTMIAGVPEPKLSRPLGDSPALQNSIMYNNSRTRGDMNVNHSQTFNINGSADPLAALHAARLSASRGQQDLLRNIQGAEQ